MAAADQAALHLPPAKGLLFSIYAGYGFANGYVLALVVAAAVMACAALTILCIGRGSLFGVPAQAAGYYRARKRLLIVPTHVVDLRYPAVESVEQTGAVQLQETSTR